MSPSSAARINLSPTSPVLASSPPSHGVAVPVDLPPPGVDTNPGIAPPEPTVAETGAPIVGTGGPSSGTLSPRRKSDAASSTLSGSNSFATAPSGTAAGTAPTSTIPPLSMPGTFDDAGWGSSGGEADQHHADGAAAPAQQQDGTEQLPTYGEGDEEAQRARDQAEAILAREREGKAGGAGFA